MLEGSLLRSVRCVPGTSRVDLPSRKGMMILRCDDFRSLQEPEDDVGLCVGISMGR